jgi:hypothetical protein
MGPRCWSPGTGTAYPARPIGNAAASSPTTAAAASPNHEHARALIIYWVVSLPFLAETAAGIQWDLARNDYVKEIFDKIGFPFYFSCFGVMRRG